MTPPFLQLQNARATENLLEELGITTPVRFEVIPAVLPVSILSTEDETKLVKIAWGFGQSNAGGAGVESHVQLFNPANSGTILRAKEVTYWTDALSTILIGLFDTALATNETTVGFQDRRLGGNPVGQIRSATNATVLGSARFRGATSGDHLPQVLQLDGYLGASQGIIVANSTSNVQLQASFTWEEFLA